MFANLSGIGVVVTGSVPETTETIERLRDLIILRLTAAGLTQRTVGRVLGMAQSTVSKRIAVIPPEAREYYGEVTLGFLGATGTEG